LKVGTAMLVLGKYLKLIFIPYPLSYYYGYSYIVPENIGQFVPLLSLAAHLALLGVALYFIRKKPWLSYSILFYLIAIAVYTNLVAPIPGLMGDRFLLVPSIGFCFFLSFVL